MAAIQDVASALAPMIAQIPMYIGQEPPDEYFNKFMQVFQYGNTLGVVGFNDAVKTRMLSSRLAERFTPPNPFQNSAGNQIVTPALFLGWLEDKYREVMIGTSQASMKALINEKFSPLDTPDSYRQRIRTFTHSIADDDCLPILYNHLPENLELRVRMTAPATKDAFFTNLRNCWLESNGSRNNIQPSNITSQSLVGISTPQISQYPQFQPPLQKNNNKSQDYLDSIAERLGYPDDGSRNPDVLNKFIDDELYNRLGHANYHVKKEPKKEPFGSVNGSSSRVIKKVYTTKKPQKLQKAQKVTYRCSNCEKLGHRKNNCPGLVKKSPGPVKKTKKVNNIYQNDSENSDDEEVLILEDDEDENREQEEEEVISDEDDNTQHCFNTKKKAVFQ